MLQEGRSTQDERISALEGQLDESRVEVLRLEAEQREKCVEIDKLRQEIDRLTQAHTVSTV